VTRPARQLAGAMRAQGALALLRCAHQNPGITRAEAASRLGLSSGSATEIMGRLRAARLLDEGPAPATGVRGRPTGVLVPHPTGPLVAVVEITHETWRVTTAEIGGRLAPAAVHHHHGSGDPGALLQEVSMALAGLHRRYGARLRAVAVSVPGSVQGSLLVQASNLRWRDVDLGVLAHVGPVQLPLTVGNDASLAGLAEALRGAAHGVTVALHLTVEVGVGGILVVDGRPMLGATGAGGEFGHMPLGPADLRCPCGAYGCWDLAVDGRAMARHLGRPEPVDPRTFADEVLLAARAGQPESSAAVLETAAALGRGIAALVNALDPAIVTLGGLGADLLEVGSEPLGAALARGVMAWRRGTAPPVVAATLGPDGPAIGAAEAAMSGLLTERALAGAI
jgi:predicted NBD/HSP70 family sugar kinase